jgi:hypothetical protein
VFTLNEVFFIPLLGNETNAPIGPCFGFFNGELPTPEIFSCQKFKIPPGQFI